MSKHNSTVFSTEDELYALRPWYENIDWNNESQARLAPCATIALLIDIKHLMEDLNENIENIQTHKMDLEFSIRRKPRKFARD